MEITFLVCFKYSPFENDLERERETEIFTMLILLLLNRLVFIRILVIYYLISIKS